MHALYAQYTNTHSLGFTGQNPPEYFNWTKSDNDLRHRGTNSLECTPILAERVLDVRLLIPYMVEFGCLDIYIYILVCYVWIYCVFSGRHIFCTYDWWLMCIRKDDNNSHASDHNADAHLSNSKAKSSNPQSQTTFAMRMVSALIEDPVWYTHHLLLWLLCVLVLKCAVRLRNTRV